MINNKKIFIISAITLSSIAIVASAVSCNKNKGYSVTFHPLEGHTISGKDKYVCKTNDEIELEPCPDQKDGFSFIGWYENQTYQGNKVNFPLKVTSNIDLYAKYSNAVGSYTVNFNTDGGSAVPTYYVKYGEQIMNSPITTKDDCLFNKWVDSHNNPITFPYKPNENTDLKATWTPVDKYFLTLNTNGGSQPENTEVVSGVADSYRIKKREKVILTSPNTTKVGFNLEGWYTSNELKEGTRVDFKNGLTLSNDLTLYAKWISNDVGHNVTLLDSDKTKELSKIENTSFIAYEPKVSKAGYAFKNWKYKSNDTDVDFTNGLKVEENLELYAVFEEIKDCTITLNDFNGEQIGDPIKYKKGEKIDSAFSYNGNFKDYGNFVGWQNGGTTITFPYVIPTDDTLTLTADIDITSANIDIIDSEENAVIKSLGNVKSIDKIPQVIKNKPGREKDYVLDHIEDKNSKTITYPFSINANKGLFDKTTKTISLKVKWDRYYQITLKYTYGDLPETNPKEFVMKHQKQTATNPIKPSSFKKITEQDRDIYRWLDENKNPVNDDTKITLDNDRTFYADWRYTHRNLKVKHYDASSKKYTEKTYNHLPVETALKDVPHSSNPNYNLVGYKLNDGTDILDLSKTITLANDNSTYVTEVWSRYASKLTIIYKDESLGIKLDNKVINEQPMKFVASSLPIPTYPNYEISGFNYTKDGVEKTYALNEEIELEDKDNATITAVWKKNTYSVTFIYNNGTSDKQVINNVSMITSDIVPTPTYSLHRFEGYFDSKGKSIIEYYNNKLTDSVEFTAKWSTDLNFTVKFNLGTYQSNAKFVDETSSTIREKSMTGQNPISYDSTPKAECDGNKFLGWFINENSEVTPSYPLTTTQILYARFAPLDNYVTICLNATEGGMFEGLGSSTTLLTVKKQTETQQGSKWSEIKQSIPNVIFTDAFTVSGWSTTSEKPYDPVTDDTTFAKDTFLYSINTEKIDTPSNFFTDSWPTFCNVAENKIVGSSYASGLEALKDKYSSLYSATSFQYTFEGETTATTIKKTADTFVGLLRKVEFNGVKFDVRIVGQGQDFDANDTNKKFPLTFEFVDLPILEVLDVKFPTSSLRNKLLMDGSIYNKMQYSLSFKNSSNTSHIMKTKKYHSGGDCDCYLFIPSAYELKHQPDGSEYTNGFLYTYYENSEFTKTTQDKEVAPYREKKYGSFGKCCYWLRSTGIDYFEFDGGKASDQEGGRIRGIDIMFCIGASS